MAWYQVALCRTYLVTVQAKSEDLAREYAAGYVCEYDGSTDDDRKRLKFAIAEIEMADNDALYADRLKGAQVVLREYRD